MAKIDLSIIIVNYNTENLLKNLLDSFKKSNLGDYKVEVIIVDNASSDGSTVMVKKTSSKTKLIINKVNKGYAGANNQGIREAKGRYMLLLNSDTLLKKDTLLKSLDFMEKRQEFALATCRVELESGALDPACHRGFPTPWAAFTYFSGLEKLFPSSRIFGQYHQTWKNLNKTHEVDVIVGAFFLIRKNVLDKVGLLDERFFIYAEDIDLCFRLRKKGYKIAFYPGTKIIHYKTSSGRKKYQKERITKEEQGLKKKTSQHFFETMKLFYDKHYKDQYSWFVRSLTLLGIKLLSKLKD